jgi:hypothetical protein
VGWDVACYDRGFGDNSKGLPGLSSGGERVKAASPAATRAPFQLYCTAQMRMNGRSLGCGVNCCGGGFFGFHIVQQRCSAPASETVEGFEGERERIEHQRKEGRCRMQDRDGSPQQDMRREDQAIGVSHGT